MTTPKINSVLFDLGSTLVYFNAPWPDSFHEMSEALLKNLQVHDIFIQDREKFAQEYFNRLLVSEPEEANNYLQTTAEQSLRVLLANFGFSSVEPDVIQSSLRRMFEVAEKYWTVEEDAPATLRALKKAGKRLAIISNAEDDENFQHIIDKAHIREYFDVILNSAVFGYAKPGSNIYLEALRQLDLSAENAVMVGDRLDTDVYGANRLGMRCVWVTRRSRHADPANPQAGMVPWKTIQTLAQLPGIILAEE